MGARLPDLLVVGAPKAGTTTLAAWLRDHPRVAFSAEKELEFFDLNFARGLGWYADQLPAAPGDRVVAEATPTYLSDARAPERIAATLPDARFVAVLRDPVARAWSHYWFFVMLGVEARSWERAVAEERDGEGPGYLWRGRYAAQLDRWERAVGEGRTHVLLLDDMVGRPDEAFAGVCAFAGLPPAPVARPSSVNPTRVPRSPRLQRALRRTGAGGLRKALYVWNAKGRPVPPVPEPVRAALSPAFEDDLRALGQRLGRPLPAAWRTGQVPVAGGHAS